jgi:short-subunit dehydrogenase
VFLNNVEARMGPFDILVNNAGIMPAGLFVDEDDAMTDRLLDINLCGVLHGSKLAAQRLRGRGGHIVNIASAAGVAAFPGVATYCATKHAVVGFSETLHVELAAAGIGVTAVLPGMVHTELSAGHRAPQWVRPITDIDPEDVAAAVVAVVGSRRTKVVVPRRLGVMLKTMGLMPDGIRHWIGRTAHFDAAFTEMDQQTRAAYLRRIATAPPSK